MQRRLLILTPMAAALVAAGCASTAPAKSVLPAGHWDAFNRAQIDDLIATTGKGSAGYSAAKPPYVVFDWDNTSVFLDIEEASLIYQLENLVFGATPAQLEAALRKNIPKTNFLPAYNNAAGKPVNIELVVPDIVASYTWLYRNYRGLKGTQSLAVVAMSPHYTAFLTKVRYLYEAIGDTFDHDTAYPWVTYLFVGMNEAQVRKLTADTVAWQLKEPIAKIKWTSPPSLPGRAGVVSVSWKNGLRLQPEMQSLYAAFRNAGFDVWVCSASFVDVIKEISSNPAFGYDNPPERVLAMAVSALCEADDGATTLLLPGGRVVVIEQPIEDVMALLA